MEISSRQTDYHYDAEGRIESVDTPEGTINYEYDQTTGHNNSTYTSNTETQYFYDELGRLETVKMVERTGQTVSEQSGYTYNPVGSRQSLLYPNGNYSYHLYNALNRLTSLTNFKQYEDNPANPSGTTLSKFQYELYADGMRKSATEKLLHPGDPNPVEENYDIQYNYDNLNRLA